MTLNPGKSRICRVTLRVELECISVFEELINFSFWKYSIIFALLLNMTSHPSNTEPCCVHMSAHTSAITTRPAQKMSPWRWFSCRKESGMSDAMSLFISHTGFLLPLLVSFRSKHVENLICGWGNITLKVGGQGYTRLCSSCSPTWISLYLDLPS